MLNTITNVFTSTTSEISSLLSDITAATGTGFCEQYAVCTDSRCCDGISD